jgi:hypothetical protein
MASPASQLVSLLWWLLLIPVAMYIGGPILIWLTFRHRVYAHNELLDPEQLPETVRQAFFHYAPALVRQGFTAIGYIRQTGSVANVHAYVACWEHQSRGQSAGILAIVPAVGLTKYSLEYETLTSPDCKVVLTSNSASATVFESTPRRDVVYLSWVQSADELYRVHLHREARLLEPAATRCLVTTDGLVDAITDGTYYQLREQSRLGLMYETRTAGTFRATPIGAIKMTWRLLPPLKQLRAAKAKKAARKAYEEAMAVPLTPPPSKPVNITHESPYESAPAGDILNYA